MSRTRPEWLVADIAAWALGAVSCPIYPQTEAGQAEFILNNTSAVAVFVENAQQAAKVESIRANCPNLRHVITFDTSGKFPAGTLTLDELGSRRVRRGAASRLGGALAGDRPRAPGHGHPYLGDDRQPQGGDDSPRQPALQLRGRRPDRRLLRGRRLPVVAAPVPHLRATDRGDHPPGPRVDRRVRRIAHRTAGGQHGRGPAHRHGRRAALLRAGLRTGRGIGRAVTAPAATDLPLGDWRGSEAVREPRRRARGWPGPEGPARHRGQAGLPPGQGPDRRAGPLLRLRLGAAVARGGGVLLRPGHPHPRGLRAVRDEPAGEHQPAR